MTDTLKHPTPAQPVRARSRAAIGVQLMLAAFVTAATWMIAGCETTWVELMVHAPNKDKTAFVGENAGKMIGADRHLLIPVGPPDAVLRVGIVEPDGEDPLRGTILVVHGYRAEGWWLMDKARSLAEAGYRAAVVDLRGHGGSSGQFITYGYQESRDLSQVIDALQNRGLAGPQVGVWGLSMGASTAIQLAGQDQRVAAVVAVAPYASMRDVVPGAVKAMTWFISPTEDRLAELVDLAGQRAGFDPDAADAVVAIQRTQAPVLIVSGDWDAICPPDHADRLAAAAGGRAERLTLPMTGHFGAGFDFNGAVRTRSASWFDEHLHRDPKRDRSKQ